MLHHSDEETAVDACLSKQLIEIVSIPRYVTLSAHMNVTPMKFDAPVNAVRFVVAPGLTLRDPTSQTTRFLELISRTNV